MSARSTLFVYLSGMSEGAWSQLEATFGTATADGILRFPLADQSTATQVSLMTGRWPDQHGVLLPEVRDPDTLAFRALSGRDRQCPSFWERMALEGQSVVSVGWPSALPTQPGESVNVVDAVFGSAQVAMPSAVFSDTVLGAVAQTLFEVWLQPDELPADALAALIPSPHLVEYDQLDQLGQLGAAITENISRHAAFLELLNNAPWRVATLHLDLLDRLARVEKSGSTAFANVSNRGIAVIEEMLTPLMQRVGSSNVILAGFPSHGGAGRVLFYGSDFTDIGQRVSVSALDLVPTIWALSGFMETRYPGRILAEILQPDVLAGRRSFRAEWQRPTGPEPLAAEHDLLAQLNPPGVQPQSLFTPLQLLQWQRAWNMTLVRSMAARGAYLEALPIVEHSVREFAEKAEILKILAEMLLRAELYEEALEVALDVAEICPVDDPDPVLLAASAHAAKGEEERARELLAEVEAMPQAPADRMRLALLYEYLEDWQAVLAYLRQRDDLPVGQIKFMAARAHLALGDWEQARDEALVAIGHDYANARAHEILGVALWGLKDRTTAMTAFATCACLMPNRSWPFQRLAQYGKLAAADLHDVEHWQLQGRLAQEHEHKLVTSYRAEVARYQEHGPIAMPSPTPAPRRREAIPLALKGLAGLPGAGQDMLREQLQTRGESFAEMAAADWATLLGLGEQIREFDVAMLYNFPASIVKQLPREHTYRLIVCRLSAVEITPEFIQRELPVAYSLLKPMEVAELLMRQQYQLIEAIEKAPHMQMIKVATGDDAALERCLEFLRLTQ